MSDPTLMPKVEHDAFPTNLDPTRTVWRYKENGRPPTSLVSEQEFSTEQANAPQQQNDEVGAIGGLMKAIFADGVHLRTEEDFVTFYLFARIMDQASRFGREGMKDAAAIHEVSACSAVLTNHVILHR
jgi:hypothetical protein